SRAGDLLGIQHSRCSDVREEWLVSCGYVVLARPAEGGDDFFVKKRKNSLCVHCQGHPEYGAQTLMKEYRRDIRRFLNRERETYPSMPRRYFDEAATSLLANFRERALSDPREEVMAAFPEAAIVNTL